MQMPIKHAFATLVRLGPGKNSRSYQSKQTQQYANGPEPERRQKRRPRQVVRQQVPAILELVGLARKAERLPDELSGGEMQRVSIARAFVNRPLILLADEPTGNLDPGTSVGIMRLLDRINRSGTTVVMATHDRGVVDTMRRRVIELDRGVIRRDESRGVYE